MDPSGRLAKTRQEVLLKRFMRPWLVVTAVTLVYLGSTIVLTGGDPLVLATLGTRFSEGDPEGSIGYDGQFAYYIASDPLGGWQHIDVPAYRYQRILFPMLGRLLALGQDSILPYALALTNIAALAAGTWCTEEILRSYGMNRWYALTYGLYGGLLASVRLTLNEPLAHALCQAALLLAERDRWRWCILLFVLAVLTKETILVFVIGYLLFLVAKRHYRKAVELALGVGVPLLLWQGVLWIVFGQPGLGSGGAGATGWEIIPYRGFWSVAAAGLGAFFIAALVMVPLAIIPSLLSLWASGRDLLKGRWHPYTTILLTNALVIVFMPRSTFLDPLAMPRLTAGLMVATILFGAAKQSRQILNYTLFWPATLVLLPRW